MPPTAERNTPHLSEGLALLTMLVVAGIFIVPCHWTSIWGDREFTGWVAPIAKRMAEGQVLYGAGAHSPMAPLPFVLLDFLFGRRAIWISENIVNFVCQGLAILTLYAGTAYQLRRPVPFLAAAGTLPVFLALPKTILYDALAQCLVAVVAVAVTAYVVALKRRIASAIDGTSARSAGRETATLACVSLLSAACLLSKQSTGSGAVLGAACAFVLLPRIETAARRWRRAGLYLVLVVVTGAALCVPLSGTISLRGLIWDVFITGSEPKGGPFTLVTNLWTYFGQLASTFFPLALTGLAVVGAAGLLGGERSAAAPDNTASQPGETTPHAPLIYSVVGLLGAALGLRALLLLATPFSGFPGTSPLMGILPMDFLATALFASVLLSVRLCCRRTLQDSDRRLYALAPMALVSLPAALFHSLSTPAFRWTYDNNPLISVALASLFAALLEAFDRLLPNRRWLATSIVAALCFAVQVALWSEANLSRQIGAVRECTQTWPEVTFLTRAKLPPRADGMRALVSVVRKATPLPGDTVLLLPNDPNVEAWFERPRPNLSSAIVFVDQYWDRYVDSDFAELERHPPKVIVIGPRGYWGIFQLAWHGNTGAARFIQRVIHELLPTSYDLATQQPIQFGGRPEFMDVYVRKDGAALAPSP